MSNCPNITCFRDSFISGRPARIRFSPGESFRPPRQLSNGIRAASASHPHCGVGLGLAQLFFEIGVFPLQRLNSTAALLAGEVHLADAVSPRWIAWPPVPTANPKWAGRYLRIG